MPTFRLDKEPWIPVVDMDGVAKEVSLVDVFAQAHCLASVAGSPLESAAITRFLLAIAHLTNSPSSLSEWKQLWDRRIEFMSDCARYVEEHGDAWELFHAEHPFGQVPNQTRTQNPAHLLVYEAARKNNAVHLDHSVEASPEAIRYGVLVRGILTANAYAGSSGGGYRSGPLAMRSVAYIQARTLADTLLLNLLVQESAPADFDWKLYGLPRNDSITPLDIARRYLWTSRSIRLVLEENGDVKTIMLAPGNEMSESDRKEDPMVVFRLDSQGKEYIPLRLDSARALWRSAHVLLNWNEEVRRLACIDQLRRLLTREYITRDQQLSIRVCAVAGDAQGPSTELWRDETLPFGVSLIVDDAKFSALTRSVNAAEELANATRSRIYSFAARYLQNGAEAKPDKSDIGRLADELSLELHDYWAMLAPMGERIACDDFDEDKWEALLKAAADHAYRKAIDRLAPDARRFRAEFARRESGEKREKQGAKA